MALTPEPELLQPGQFEVWAVLDSSGKRLLSSSSFDSVQEAMRKQPTTATVLKYVATPVTNPFKRTERFDPV